MDYTTFWYATFDTTDEFNPHTAELTCAEIVSRRLRLETTTRLLSFPDQTIVHPTGFIPLYVIPIRFTLNSAGVSQIMSGFSVGAIDSFATSLEIDKTLTSLSSEGKEVTEIKILKITTKVYEIDRESEELLMERYSCVPVDDSRVISLFGYNSNGSKECVIYLEDYIEGSIMTKLPCDHHFHGVCINK